MRVNTKFFVGVGGVFCAGAVIPDDVRAMPLIVFDPAAIAGERDFIAFVRTEGVERVVQESAIPISHHDIHHIIYINPLAKNILIPHITRIDKTLFSMWIGSY